MMTAPEMRLTHCIHAGVNFSRTRPTIRERAADAEDADRPNGRGDGEAEEEAWEEDGITCKETETRPIRSSFAWR